MDALLAVCADGVLLLKALPASTDGVTDFDVVFANGAAMSMLGPDIESIDGLRLSDLFWGDDLRERRAVLARAMSSSAPVDVELPARGCGDRFVRARVVALDAAFVAILSKDITEERRRNEALRLGAERLELALDGAELGLWDWDIPTGEVHFNDRWASMLGFAPSEIGATIDGWSALVHPEDLAPTWELVRAHLDGRTAIYESEHRLATRGGGWCWVLDRGRVVERDAGGRPVRMAGTHLDITTRKQADEALRRTEESLDLALRGADLGLWDWDRRTGEHRVNDRWASMLGLTIEEAPKTLEAWRAMIHPDDRDAAWEAASAHLRGTTPSYEAEFRMRTRDGSWKWILSRGKVMERDAEGRPARLAGTHLDISGRKASEIEIARHARDLAETGRFLDSIVENVPAMLFVKDARDLRFVRWNRGAERITGLVARDVLGKTDADLFAPEQAARFNSRDRAVLEGSVEEDIALEPIDDARGQRRWLHTRKTMIRGPRGEAAYLLGISEDVTIRRTAEQAMLEAKEAAEAAARTKSRFLANMSHELRTPMNGVLGMTDLLLDSELTPEQRECVEIIRSSGRTLLEILDEILDYSKLEAGRVTIENLPFDPVDLAEETVAMLAARAQAKALEMLVEAGPGVPSSVSGDPRRIRQILSNLVGNAIKFTDRGEIVVSLSWAPDGILRFEVRDSGIGIAPEALARLFRPFEQADGSTTRRYGGTGLGLSICRKLVECMRGRIEVDSVPGTGSTFWFELPLAPSAGTDPLPGLSGGRICVAHPHPGVRRRVAGLLESWGIEVTSIVPEPDPEATIDAIGRLGVEFDAVILDAGSDGAAGACASRLPSVRLRRTGVVLLSRWSDHLRIPPAACALVLPKPVRARALHAVITRLLEGGPGAHPPDPAPHTPPPTRGTVLLVEDNPVNQKVASRMLERLGCRVVIAGDGVEALETVAPEGVVLVLMDCQMPRMDGFETSRAWRAREADLGLVRKPIVALTAHAMESERRRCLEAGMDAFAAKPLTLQALSALLDRWLPAGPVLR